MLSSMTGFGRATADLQNGKLVVEILSVNRKYFEVAVSLPKELARFEYEVRKQVSAALSRGQITVRVSLSLGEESVEESLPSAEKLQGLKRGWEALAQKIGADPKAVDLPFLAAQLVEEEGTLFIGEEGLAPLQNCVQEALQALLQMKRAEGNALVKDVGERLRALEGYLISIEKLSPEASRKMREKLVQKLKEVEIEQGSGLEERALREVILFAEKMDIAEEITRLRSHFTQFKKLLEYKEKPVGRKMDFLLQEMGREVNTISAKSAEAKISHLVVEMKNELERMREQIQNIE